MLSGRRKLTPMDPLRSMLLPKSHAAFACRSTQARVGRALPGKAGACGLPKPPALNLDVPELEPQAETWSFEYLSPRLPGCTVPEALAGLFPWTNFDQGLPEAAATSLSV